jgi:hypothetical protein
MASPLAIDSTAFFGIALINPLWILFGLALGVHGIWKSPMSLSRKIVIGLYCVAGILLAGLSWWFGAVEAHKTNMAKISNPCDLSLRSDGEARNYLIGIKQKTPNLVPSVVHIKVSNENCRYAIDLQRMFTAAGWGNILKMETEDLLGDGIIFHARKDDEVAITLYGNLAGEQAVRLDFDFDARAKKEWVFWIKDSWPTWVSRAKMGH